MDIKNYITFLLLYFTCATPLFAETIVLKSGQKVEGKLLEKTNEYIKINFQGVVLTYFNDQVESIEGEKPTIGSQVFGKEKSESILHSDKSPSQIFKEASPGIVVIRTSIRDSQMTLGIKEYAQGSGFVVNKNGIILTNFHVVDGADLISVTFNNGKNYDVKEIIYYEPRIDICLLKIDANGLEVLPLADADRLEVGDKVIVIGAPLGYEYSLTEGILSAKRYETYKEMLQFTAPISPGNSGGPLLNASGRVVGLITSVAPGGQNINFALSINQAKHYIDLYPSEAIPIQSFANHIRENYRLRYLAEESARNNDAERSLRYLRDGFNLCLQKNKNCLWEGLDLITRLNSLAVTYFQNNEIVKAENYSKEAVSVVESLGGAEVLINRLRNELYWTDLMLSEARENIVIGGYYILAVIYINRGNIEGAQPYLEKIKSISPASEKI